MRGGVLPPEVGLCGLSDWMGFDRGGCRGDGGWVVCLFSSPISARPDERVDPGVACNQRGVRGGGIRWVRTVAEPLCESWAEGRWFERLPLLAVVVGAVLLATGYTMPSGNHAVQVPPILSMLEPGLYARDFHVQEMSRFSVRTYFIWMIGALARAGLGVPWAFLLTYLVAVGGVGRCIVPGGSGSGSVVRGRGRCSLGFRCCRCG